MQCLYLTQELESETYKKCLQLFKKTTKFFKNRQSICTDMSQNRKGWLISHKKVLNIIRHQGKASETTIRYHHTSIHTEWLKLKCLALLPAGEDAVQMELSNIVGKSIKGHNHFVTLFGSLSQSKI